MRKIAIVLCIVLFCSCTEKLINKPKDLIPEEKITLILYHMALLNAVKNTNAAILKDNGIDPMTFLFSKYKIDSIQFVESSRYYASLPQKYEAIYTHVNEKIKRESKRIKNAKRIADSLKVDSLKIEEQKNIHKEVKGYVKEVNDSLQ